jgi:PAS domain S-box-containing protein
MGGTLKGRRRLGSLARLFHPIRTALKRNSRAEGLGRENDRLNELARERAEALLEKAPVGIFEIDLVERKFLSVNDVVVRLTGYSRKELLAMDPAALLLPEHRARFLDRLRRVAEDEAVPASVEYGFRTRSGETRWGLLNTSFDRENGLAVRARVTATDITARKTAEEALRASEERLRQALEAARMAAWEYDPSTRKVTFSENADWVLGQPSRPKDSDQGYALIHPDDVERHRALVSEAIATGGSYVSVYRHVFGEQEIWLEEHGRAVVNQGGQTERLVGVVQNITARKQAEEKLRRQQAEIQSLLENTPAGLVLFEATPPYRVLAHNRYYQELFAEPFRSRGMVGLSVYDYAPAVEAEGVVAVFDEAVRTKQPKSFLDFPYRSDPPKRSWFNWHISPLILDGRLVALVSMSLDVTDRHLAQEALRDSEEQFRVLIQNLRSAVALVDERGAFTIVNRAFRLMFDIPEEDDILNVNSRDWGQWQVFDETGTLLGVDEHPVRKAALKRAAVKNELVAVKPPSCPDLKWLLVSAEPILDGQGNIHRLICTYYDITERKAAEAALRRSEARWNAALESFAEGAIIATEDEQVVYWNPAAQAMHGFTRPGVGLEPLEKTPVTFQLWTSDGSHRLELDEWPLRRIKRGETVRDMELRVRRPDQNWEKVFSYSGAMVETAGGERLIFLSCRDLTEQRRAEQSLRLSEARFRLALRHAPVSLAAQDRQLRYIWAYNQKSAQPDQIIGHFDEEIFTPDEAAHFAGLKRRVLEEGVELREQRWLERPSGPMFLDISWEPIRDEAGTVVGVASATIDLTPIKLAEEALSRTSQKNAEILASIQDDFYVLDRNWDFVYANRLFTAKIGKEPADFVGHNIWKMFPKHAGTVFEENLRAAMERREIRRFEVHGQYTDAWYRMTAFPSAEGITVLGTDITPIKRAEELRLVLIEQEKLRLGAAVEQASDSIVIADLDGTIRYVNAAFETINRIGRRQAIGRSYFEFLAGMSPAAGDIRQAMAARRPWRAVLTGAVQDGRPVDLDATISPIKDPSGALIGSLITEKDVTREIALENQVRQAQKMEALGTLAGGITHDFNNILGTIVLNTELALLDLEPTAPARLPLPLVLQAANRGKELVKQIITFSRQRAWERKPLEIVPVVKEVLKFLRTALPKDISIHEAIDDASGVVLADPSHIHQVLVNLCQNAALAMDVGGGRIDVRLAPVEIDEALAVRHPNLRPGPYVQLTVSDTGCGMTKDVRDRIFEPFFTTRAPGKGSGLGLAVVHGIVGSYNGEITVASEPGRGSTFHIYLPRLLGEKPAASAEDDAGPEPGQDRVLLIEDETAQREGLERGLRHLGYRVTALADGRSALAALKDDPAAFDLVITDQIMPMMTGLELASAISALRRDIPIILCTGYSEKVSSGVAGESGVREILMKPYTIREISRLIRKVLSSEEQTGGGGA